jgi:hypothetical protein
MTTEGKEWTGGIDHHSYRIWAFRFFDQNLRGTSSPPSPPNLKHHLTLTLTRVTRLHARQARPAAIAHSKSCSRTHAMPLFRTEWPLLALLGQNQWGNASNEPQALLRPSTTSYGLLRPPTAFYEPPFSPALLVWQEEGLMPHLLVKRMREAGRVHP